MAPGLKIRNCARRERETSRKRICRRWSSVDFSKYQNMINCRKSSRQGCELVSPPAVVSDWSKRLRSCSSLVLQQQERASRLFPITRTFFHVIPWASIHCARTMRKHEIASRSIVASREDRGQVTKDMILKACMFVHPPDQRWM